MQLSDRQFMIETRYTQSFGDFSQRKNKFLFSRRGPQKTLGCAVRSCLDENYRPTVPGLVCVSARADSIATGQTPFMGSYRITPPPHIVSSDSVSGMMWKSTASLLPLIVVRTLLSGVSTIQCLLVSLIFACAASWTARVFFNRSAALSDGRVVLVAALMTAVLPSGLPLWMVALGNFTAVFLGLEIFGGPGAGPFHPVAIGAALLEVCFPGYLSRIGETVIAGSGPWLFLAGKNGGEWISIHAGFLISAAAVLSGLLLIGQKIVRWEVPLFYLGSVYLLSVVFGGSFFHFQLILYAFFVMTDPASTCMTRKGRVVVAAIAAVLTYFLSRGGLSDGGLPFAVLLTNAVSPWMDLLTQPSVRVFQSEDT